jgi:hypothetical protein
VQVIRQCEYDDALFIDGPCAARCVAALRVEAFFSRLATTILISACLDKALDEGRKRGWAITDMKRDCRTIFPAEGTIGATRDPL